MLHALRVPAWRRALLAGRVLAGSEHVSVLQNLGDVQSVIDIGANRGQFALAARHCFPGAGIFSFEPLSVPAETFRQNFANDSKVRLIESGVAQIAGEADIHVSGRDDSSSFLPITPQQNALFPGTAEVGTVRVRVGRLSDLLPGEAFPAPVLLKIDVQGFELQALNGCEDLMQRITWVYVECSFIELYEGQALADTVIAWLCARGLRLVGVYNLTQDSVGRAIQADFLFGRSGPQAA